MDYNYYMQKAIEQARLAYDANETPIGCVITLNGKIIARGYNKRNTMKNTLFHAEMEAINQACRTVNDWRLEECILFVTIEPCPMCAGAIVQARIKEVVFGARNKKAGCGGSVLNILNCGGFNHQVKIIEGVMEEKCGGLMNSFFNRLRKPPSITENL